MKMPMVMSSGVEARVDAHEHFLSARAIGPPGPQERLQVDPVGLRGSATARMRMTSTSPALMTRLYSERKALDRTIPSRILMVLDDTGPRITESGDGGSGPREQRVAPDLTTAEESHRLLARGRHCWHRAPRMSAVTTDGREAPRQKPRRHVERRIRMTVALTPGQRACRAVDDRIASISMPSAVRRIARAEHKRRSGSRATVGNGMPNRGARPDEGQVGVGRRSGCGLR